MKLSQYQYGFFNINLSGKFYFVNKAHVLAECLNVIYHVIILVFSRIANGDPKTAFPFSFHFVLRLSSISRFMKEPGIQVRILRCVFHARVYAQLKNVETLKSRKRLCVFDIIRKKDYTVKRTSRDATNFI